MPLYVPIADERLRIGEMVTAIFKYNPVSEQIETHVIRTPPDQRASGVAIEAAEPGRQVRIQAQDGLDNPMRPIIVQGIAEGRLQRGQYVRKIPTTWRYEQTDSYYGSDGLAMTGADNGQAVAIAINVERMDISHLPR